MLFPTPEPRENSDPLTTANREKSIHGSHTGFKRSVYRLPFERVWWFGTERNSRDYVKLSLAINWMTKPVEDSSKHSGSYIDTESST